MLAYGGCQNDPNPVIGCEPDPVPQAAGFNKLAYGEFRGATGIGAQVLADGTLVAMDFASGEIVFRTTSGHEHRIHRDQLPPEARSQFIELARRSAADPGFSFEVGTGPAPGSGGPVIPFWGYPLQSSMFRFSNYHLHQKSGDDDDSPCETPSGCDPPVELERVHVVGVRDPGGSSGHAIWLATLERPFGGVRNDVPQWYLDLDRQGWENWRTGRCEAINSYKTHFEVANATLVVACASLAPALVSLALAPPVGAMPTVYAVLACTIAVVATKYTAAELADGVSDCRSDYPGPSNWP